MIRDEGPRTSPHNAQIFCYHASWSLFTSVKIEIVSTVLAETILFFVQHIAKATFLVTSERGSATGTLACLVVILCAALGTPRITLTLLLLDSCLSIGNKGVVVGHFLLNFAPANGFLFTNRTGEALRLRHA